MRLRDKVTTRKGFSIELPFVCKQDDCRILIAKGTMGEICGIRKFDEITIRDVEVKFELSKGISLFLSKIVPQDVEIVKDGKK
jgi:hypothetical protein